MPETQGDRVRLVREALGMQQPAFADLLNDHAEQLGLRVRYDNTAISKLENGRRDLSVDDLFVICAVDPQHRGERWLGLGEGPTQGRGAPPDTPRHEKQPPPDASIRRRGNGGGSSRSA